MTYIIPPDYCTSPSVLKVLERLNAKRMPPSVNLPALARRDASFMSCWEADPGKVFISSDFVSLEPSITASFAEDSNYRYATFEGIGKEPYVTSEGILMIDDVYLMVASVMPGEVGETIRHVFSDPNITQQWLIDPEAVKENKLVKPARKKAKPACLGFNYGMGPKRFVKQAYDAGMNIELNEARQMYKAYWDLFPGIRKLVQQLEFILKRDAFMMNPFGYRLTTDAHKGYNAFIQSTASGVLDVFCLKFFAKCSDAEFIAMIHDEVVYQVPESKLNEIQMIQEECVTSLNHDLRFHVPMRLGFTVAKTFAEIK